MFQYLALTDGVTTVELTDGINYALVSYAPVVAPLNKSLLGPTFPDATETITFHAIGCTAAEAYAAVAAVNRLLDQATRWWQGENENAVLLVAQAQGTALAALSVAIKGRSPTFVANVALPAVYHENYGKYIIQNVTITFVRRGQWLGTTESAASGSAANPNILTVTLPTSPVDPCPIDVRIGSFGAQATNFPWPGGFILVGPNASGFLILEAETLVTGGKYTSFADGANNARGGNVLRYTPTDALLNASAFVLLTGLSAATRRIAIFAAVRNNTTTNNYLVTVKIAFAGGVVRTMPVAIDTSTTNPRVVFLGSVFIPAQADNVTLEITAVNGAVGSLDIDYLVFQDIDDETSRAVAIPAQTEQSILIAQLNIAVESQLLSRPGARVVAKDGTVGAFYMSYQGDPFLMSKGATVNVVMLATGGLSAGVANNWRYFNGGVVNLLATITRTLAYMVPV